MVFRPKVIHDEADPAGSQNYNRANDLSDDRNGLFADVNDRQYGKDKANKIDYCFHLQVALF